MARPDSQPVLVQWFHVRIKCFPSWWNENEWNWMRVRSKWSTHGLIIAEAFWRPIRNWQYILRSSLLSMPLCWPNTHYNWILLVPPMSISHWRYLLSHSYSHAKKCFLFMRVIITAGESSSTLESRPQQMCLHSVNRSCHVSI